MVVDVLMVEARASLGVLGYRKRRDLADDREMLLEVRMWCPVEHRCS